ncbi:MAG: AtuA-related protein, partial [Burkholderiales bacterium]
ATYLDGHRSSAQLSIIGFDAAKKARRTAEAILERTRGLFAAHNFGDYTGTNIEILGAESCYGPHARSQDAREVVMRLSVRHPNKEALEIFAREIAAAGTSWSPGTTGAGGSGRPRSSPSIKQFAFLLEKTRVTPVVTIDAEEIAVSVPAGVADSDAPQPAKHNGKAEAPRPSGEVIEVPLIKIAYGRSGDKGDTSNIGLIARSRDLLPVLRQQVTEQRVGEWLGHLVKGNVTRYDLPGIRAVNFVCESALGGGGMASLRNDPLGKGMAQILLAMPVQVPRALVPAA